MCGRHNIYISLCTDIYDMSTIKVSVNVKDSLKEFGEGASIDKALVKLLDASDKPKKNRWKKQDERSYTP